MYCVLAEDESDVATLRVLLRRLTNWSRLPVDGKGCSGAGDLLNKGARLLGLYRDKGCRRFIVCYDADRHNVAVRRNKIIERIIQPAGLTDHGAGRYVVIIPVQAIEAWILADYEHAIPKVINNWTPSPIAQPETVGDPKAHLESQSRIAKSRPRYSHATHNDKVARYLRLDVVQQKCPSFRPLAEFVTPVKTQLSPPMQFPGKAGTEVWIFAWVAGQRRPITSIAQASEWGRLDSYVKAQKPARVSALLHLCHYGWCRLEELRETCNRLSTSKAQGQIKQILRALLELETDEHVTHVSLDDGTR